MTSYHPSGCFLLLCRPSQAKRTCQPNIQSNPLSMAQMRQLLPSVWQLACLLTFLTVHQPLPPHTPVSPPCSRSICRLFPQVSSVPSFPSPPLSSSTHPQRPSLPPTPTPIALCLQSLFYFLHGTTVNAVKFSCLLICLVVY